MVGGLSEEGSFAHRSGVGGTHTADPKIVLWRKEAHSKAPEVDGTSLGCWKNIKEASAAAEFPGGWGRVQKWETSTMPFSLVE